MICIYYNYGRKLRKDDFDRWKSWEKRMEHFFEKSSQARDAIRKPFLRIYSDIFKDGIVDFIEKAEEEIGREQVTEVK